MDAKKASYGVDNALFAVTQLAQTTMRSDIGKISLDKTFEERDTLNRNIVEAIRWVRQQKMLSADAPAEEFGSRMCGDSFVFHVRSCPYAAFVSGREAASDWGLQCMRYEIRDINPPAGVRAAMELQARAMTNLPASGGSGSC